jgi:lipoprotein-releasing system permease protein
MRLSWIWFTASRFIFRKQKKSPSATLSVLGIGTGVLALIVIIAVMNGFQLSFIESILEISSYHLRVMHLSDEEKMQEARSMILAMPGVQAAVPFCEFQGLARGTVKGQKAALVRGLPPDAMNLDAAMAAKLVFEEGQFDLENRQNALLGAGLAASLGVKIGDTISLFSIPAIFSAADEEDDQDIGAGWVFTVTGIFRTGFFEYDTSWIIIDINSAQSFSQEAPTLGVKLKNRFQDRQVLGLVAKAFEEKSGFENSALSSWRDYNRSFFGALRTEKLFMFILVGLIFIVVGLNIYQAQRRAVLEHREDIGLLRAIGGDKHAVRLIFVVEGAVIGFSGAAGGLILGLLIASNIPSFFTIIETIVNFFVQLISVVAMGTGDAKVDMLFSPEIFYIKEIPSRIIPREAFLIFMFGFLSASVAAWLASRKISLIHPAEVLRYE